MSRTEGKEYWELIWDKFKDGDRNAFETIYNEFADAMFSYGIKFTRHKHLVEDAIQDTFLDIYSYKERLRKPESLEFYLYKSLKNNIIKKLKEKNRFTPTDELIARFDLIFSLEETVPEEFEEHIKLLKNELESLDDKKRELLFLKFTSGLTYKEIGELLDIKSDTVKKQVYRILKLLRGKLGDNFMQLFMVFFKG